MATGTESRWKKSIMDVEQLKIGGTALTATSAEVNKLAGVTAGTTTASKALVVGASKDLDALTVLGLTIDTGTKTAAATAGAATLNKRSGKITTESLTTAQNAFYTLTLTNSTIAAADLVFASVANGDNTQGTPMIEKVTPAAGSVVIRVVNKHATLEALNGTLVVSFLVIKA